MSYAYSELTVFRFEVTLWSLLVVAVLGDIATTIVGLRIGFVETNPLLHLLMGATGLIGLFVAKAAYLALALWVVRIVDWGEWLVLAVATGIEFLVVGINLYVLTNAMFADVTVYEVIGA